MSLKQTQWAWSIQIKSGPKYVLLALADYADDFGKCYPSLKQLQKKTGISRSALINHLMLLRNENLISVQKQYDKNGYRRQNLYFLQSNLSPDFKPAKVQNLDGNNINSHQYSHKHKSPESGLKVMALEGAI